MKKLIVLIALISIFLVGCENNNSNRQKEEARDKVSIETIDETEVKKISDEYAENSKIRIVDVRTEEEYREGHIKNSINIPVDAIDEIDLSKDIEIVVYCRSGSRSYQAAIVLNDLGYTVRDMGGLDNWGYELEN